MKSKLRYAYARGRTLALRAPTREDVLGPWRDWFSDEEVSRYLWIHFWPYTREQQLAWFRGLSRGPRERFAATIVRASDGRPVGAGKLDRINWQHRFAEVTMVLGDRSVRRGPAALEAYGLLLRAAFERLNLDSVVGQYASGNTVVARLHALLGFKPRGRLPGLLDIGGRREDLVIATLDRASWLRRRAGR